MNTLIDWNRTTSSRAGALKRLIEPTFAAALLPACVLLLSVPSSRAGSASWSLIPGNGDWSTAANWTPATVPNGAADSATFGLSNTSAILFSATTEVNGIVFNSGATAFTITAYPVSSLLISGVGITNNAGVTQNFVSVGQTLGQITFANGATAGSNTTFTNKGGALGRFGGVTSFSDNSTAGSGTFVANGGEVTGAFYGATIFTDTSTAGNGTFITNGGAVSGASGGLTDFRDSSNAGTGTFTTNGGVSGDPNSWGELLFENDSSAASGTFTNVGAVEDGAPSGKTLFLGTSTAGTATLIATEGSGGGEGGAIEFFDDSSGGSARVEVFGNGSMNIGTHNIPGLTVGSIEGSGKILLAVFDYYNAAGRTLTVGSNNLSTVFSGQLLDEGPLREGSLEKIGAGSLTLSGSNTYLGSTVINGGKLIAVANGALSTTYYIGVLVSGASLALESGTTTDYLSDNLTLELVSGASVELNFEGPPDQIAALFIDGELQADGLYGSADSNATHKSAQFTGSGTLQVGAVATAQALNLSTRMRVQTGDNVGIGGFIITGSVPKHVLVRAIGPSLTQLGVPDALADPVLELHGPAGFVTIINDNWMDDPVQKAAIIATGIPPTNNLESAIDVTLNPGSYTAIVTGKDNSSGVALVEVYDLSQAVDSRLANISTRAFVSTDDNAVIAGFILGNGNGDDTIVVRGIGPSLTGFGVPTALTDSMLELRDGNGALLVANNDWQDDPAQAAIITAKGLAPCNTLESAIVTSLAPGSYTVLLLGVNNATGVGLVEVYDNPADGPPPPCPCAPPTPTTNAATNVASTSATLNGTVNPNGYSTTVYFEYGITTSYGSTTENQVFAGTTTWDVSTTINGLTPGATYHFRIVATNCGGTTYGVDNAFVAVPPAPIPTGIYAGTWTGTFTTGCGCLQPPCAESVNETKEIILERDAGGNYSFSWVQGIPLSVALCLTVTCHLTSLDVPVYAATASWDWTGCGDGTLAGGGFAGNTFSGTWHLDLPGITGSGSFNLVHQQ